MFVEYEGLWVYGGSWLFNLAYACWIWEDSQKHKKRVWPWLFILSLGNPFWTYANNLYRYELLPSRGIYPYLVPLFKYDAAQFADPIWVLDTLFLWGAVRTVISETIIIMILFWIYMDCQKSGTRATPWICSARFIQIAPFPINYFIPLGGFTGQVFILIGYILHKHGYL